MDDKTLTDLGAQAERVGLAERDRQAAVADERRAMAEFLERLVSQVRPALPAISSRLGADGTERGVVLVPGAEPLWLLEDGDFAVGPLRGARKSPEEVAARWRMRGVRKIVEALRQAMLEQEKVHTPRPLPRKAELAARCRRNAAKLHAIATLLDD